MKVRIAGLSYESVSDGPGLRTTLFFQGCPHACRGCHNPQTWDPSGGDEWDLEELIQSLKITPILSGITLSGGEPFAQALAAAQIAGYVKSLNKNVWVYTGYRWEQLLANLNHPGFQELLGAADVVVDGPFQEKQKKLNLPYRGSLNQRIVDIRQSLRENRVVEMFI